MPAQAVLTMHRCSLKRKFYKETTANCRKEAVKAGLWNYLKLFMQALKLRAVIIFTLKPQRISVINLSSPSDESYTRLKATFSCNTQPWTPVQCVWKGWWTLSSTLKPLCKYIFITSIQMFIRGKKILNFLQLRTLIICGSMKQNMCLQYDLNITWCSLVFLKLPAYEGGMSFFPTNTFFQVLRIHCMHTCEENDLWFVCAEHLSTILCLL